MSFTRPEVVVNQNKKANPLIAKVIENRPLVEGVEDCDVRHIVLDTSDYPYLEGQSAGVLPPGENEKGKPHAVRLYSIASMGTDVENTEKLSLCVKRLVYTDESGEQKFGVASNYICDLKAGEEVRLTGPAGRKYLLPVTEERNRPYIFVATGTGIAPFRAMAIRLLEKTAGFNQPIHLLFGVRRQAEALYDEEFEKIKHENFFYHKALSREQKNKSGGRYYVNDLLLDNAEALWPLLKNKETLIYICGLKGMEEGINNAIKQIAADNGEDGEAFLEQLSEQVLTEVY